jgi:hypothetical protein
VRAIADVRIKSDTIDSQTLAHLLRADLIPAAHASSKEVRAVKRVLRQRLFFVRVQTMMKSRIRALLTQHAIVLPGLPMSLPTPIRIRALQLRLYAKAEKEPLYGVTPIPWRDDRLTILTFSCHLLSYAPGDR